MTQARIPRQRTSLTTSVRAFGVDGRVIVAREDGRPAEVHLMLSGHGSAESAMAEALGTAISLGLSHGAPVDRYDTVLSALGLAAEILA